MLYHLLYPLHQELAFANIFRYITFRSFLAFLITSIIAIFLGKPFIRFMQKKQFGQSIRETGPESHHKKSGTPTMGGIFLLGSVFICLLLLGNFQSFPLIISLCVMLSYFLLGGIDDYLKIAKKNSDGVSGKVKLAWQFSTAAVILWLLIDYQIIDTKLYLPFIKEGVIDLGMGYIAFGAFVIVGSSNAVNLTDGLDGLAGGTVAVATAALGLLCYVAGNTELANYLYIPFIAGSGELSVLCASIIGACLGFLWYNAHPAQVFMGDVGSLSLGGVLGTMAVVTKNEFLFAFIGGIFVLEAVSVILQVGSFKLRKKRIFKMAPIHHHFELKGWSESKVIVRFWIIGICLAILSLATLKLR